MDWGDAPFWIAFGLLGNLAFFSRFLVQWIASERAGRSYIPLSFWYLSLAGSVILLLYAIHRRDPIFTLAYLPNSVVYVRNLVLIRRQGTVGSPSLQPPDPPAAAHPHPPGEVRDLNGSRSRREGSLESARTQSTNHDTG